MPPTFHLPRGPNIVRLLRSADARKWIVAAMAGGFLACCLGIGQHTLAAETKLKGPPVGVSASRGFCDAPFALQLTAPAEGGSLLYTLDGTKPELTNGTVYSSPLTVSKTTLLRVAAFKDRAQVSSVTTHSYLFLDQVLRQPKDPPGYPSGPRAWNGLPSAYQMDARVVDDPVYRDRMRDALKSLPAVSIVCGSEAMFGSDGLYLNTTQRGEEWEKECSAEMILPDGSTAFQIDCGLRIQGGKNRLPNRSPKHSFRLVFKTQYGAGKLHYAVFPDAPVKKFDTLVLRADYNNSWVHWDAVARPRAQRTRDAWMKDSHRAMGWVAPHSRYAHLFLNGLYWGVYDFTERPDADFAAAYFGGSQEDYDVVNEFDAKDGTLDQFTAMNSLTGLAGEGPYRNLQQLLDVTNYIDYLLLNYYAGNQDWGENKNWYAIRRRAPAGLFQYIMWDGEQLLHDVRDNTVTDPFEVPLRMAEELKGNTEFRLAFADRVQKHFFGDGALTPGASAERWLKRAKEVDRAIIAESARWGYYRRNTPFTRDKEWMVEQQRLLTDYFPQRTTIVLEQLRDVGLYPEIAPPSVRREVDGKVALSGSSDAVIYFTTNGPDPRVAFTGAIAPDALRYSKAVVLSSATTMKARAWQDGTWSALVEATSAKPQ